MSSENTNKETSDVTAANIQPTIDALRVDHGEGYGRIFFTRVYHERLFEALRRNPEISSFSELKQALRDVTEQGGRSRMTQEVSPEIQAAAEALRKQISLTETEIAPMKEIIDAKENLIREWRGMLHTLLPGSEPDPFDFPSF